MQTWKLICLKINKVNVFIAKRVRMMQVDEDFSDAFIDAIEAANRQATPWELQAVKCVTSVMRERLLAGPINLLQAFKISSALPLVLYTAMSSPPLTKWVHTHPKFTAPSPAPAKHLLQSGHKAGEKPKPKPKPKRRPHANIQVAGNVNPEELILDATQGLRAWYYVLAQAKLPSGKSAPMFLILYQSGIHAKKGVSAWACMASATEPDDTNAWLSAPCLAILDSSQVQMYFDRVTIQSPQVTGYIDFSSAPHRVTVDVTFAAAAFAFKADIHSAYGPVVHSRGKSVSSNGPLQTRRWSLVDGTLTAATVKVGTVTRTATSGVAWVDFQQQGVAHIPPLLRFIQSTLNTANYVESWLEISFQTPDAAVYIMLKEPTKNNAPSWLMHGKCTVWSSKAGAQECHYGVPVTVKINSVDALNLPPASMLVRVEGQGEFVLSSRDGAPAAATFIASLFYITPCTVATAGNPTVVIGAGNLQFAPPTLTPAEIIASAGLSRRLVHAMKPSETARAALALGVLAVACVIAAVLTSGVTALKRA